MDRSSRNLAPRAAEVLQALGEPHYAKPELFQSIVELNSRACADVPELRADMGPRMRALQALLPPLGMGCLAIGAHPFADWRQVPTTPEPRYDAMLAHIGWPARRLLICGTHVHVGVPNGDLAAALLAPLSVFAPHFIALSASSPYWLGQDTGMDSARTQVFGGMPKTGLPPQLDDWAAFTAAFAQLQAADMVRGVRDLWWDIRPHPQFGTLELRLCDAVNSLDELCTLAALAQALVAELLACQAAGTPLPQLAPLLLSENKWRAARFGLDAQLIVDDQGRQQPLRQHLLHWHARLLPHAQRLGAATELARLPQMLRQGNSASRQRQQTAANTSLPELVDALVFEFEAELPR